MQQVLIPFGGWLKTMEWSEAKEQQDNSKKNTHTHRGKRLQIIICHCFIASNFLSVAAASRKCAYDNTFNLCGCVLVFYLQLSSKYTILFCITISLSLAHLSSSLKAKTTITVCHHLCIWSELLNGFTQCATSRWEIHSW